MAIPFRQTAWKQLRPVLYRFCLPSLISLGVPPSQLPLGEAIFILNASKGNAANGHCAALCSISRSPYWGPWVKMFSMPDPAG